MVKQVPRIGRVDGARSRRTWTRYVPATPRHDVDADADAADSLVGRPAQRRPTSQRRPARRRWPRLRTPVANPATILAFAITDGLPRGLLVMKTVLARAGFEVLSSHHHAPSSR